MLAPLEGERAAGPAVAELDLRIRERDLPAENLNAGRDGARSEVARVWAMQRKRCKQSSRGGATEVDCARDAAWLPARELALKAQLQWSGRDFQTRRADAAVAHIAQRCE